MAAEASSRRQKKTVASAMAASMPPPRVSPAGAELGLLAFLECGGDAREGEGKGTMYMHGREPEEDKNVSFSQ